MDGARFDSLTRALAGSRSRRYLIGLLAALAFGAPGARLEESAAGANREKRRGRGGKKRRRPPRAAPITLPPPAPPTCPQAAAPHFCASANVCLPACAADQVFDAAACRCRCAQPHTCCRCTHQQNGAFLCFPDVANAAACTTACQDAGGSDAAFLAESGSVAVCDHATESCRFTCSAGRICGVANVCQSATALCAPGAACSQPLGGGPTRCGVIAACGCASHQECVDELGIAGAMCLDLTGCLPCDGFNTACAVPAAETLV